MTTTTNDDDVAVMTTSAMTCDSSKKYIEMVMLMLLKLEYFVTRCHTSAGVVNRQKTFKSRRKITAAIIQYIEEYNSRANNMCGNVIVFCSGIGNDRGWATSGG